MQACALLGIGQSYMSALKRAMGIRSRYFFLSDVRRFMRKNLTFRVSQIYPLTKTIKPNKPTTRPPMKKPVAPTSISPISPAEVQPPSGMVLSDNHYPAEPESNGTQDQQPPSRVKNWRRQLLARKVRAAFGNRSTSELVQALRLSRETVRRLQSGIPTKLSTLKGITKDKGISESEWVDLLICWIGAVLGDDADLLRVERATVDVGGAGNNSTGQLAALFSELSLKEQDVILDLLQHREMITCFTPLLEFLSGRTAKAIVACPPPNLDFKASKLSAEVKPNEPTPDPTVCPSRANRSRRTELLERRRRQDLWLDI